jgi:hypothetical protein
MKVFRQVWPPDVQATACGCVGPQNGEPQCPCRMRGLRQLDGRWVEVIDHGPVAPRHAPPATTGGVIVHAVPPGLHEALTAEERVYTANGPWVAEESKP